MKILDLDNLDILEIKKKEVTPIAFDLHTENMIEKPYRVMWNYLESVIEDYLKSITFPIKYADIVLSWTDSSFEKNDLSAMAEIISEFFMAQLTTNELRERESRLSVPPHLRSNKLSRMKLLKLINNKAKIGGFRLCALINGVKFKIV